MFLDLAVLRASTRADELRLQGKHEVMLPSGACVLYLAARCARVLQGRVDRVVGGRNADVLFKPFASFWVRALIGIHR